MATKICLKLYHEMYFKKNNVFEKLVTIHKIENNKLIFLKTSTSK
jgi:hypothetical protein